jgi:hypothetical protein
MLRLKQPELLDIENTQQKPHQGLEPGISIEDLRISIVVATRPINGGPTD